MTNSATPLVSPEATSAVVRKRRWPDLSAYGIHFGVTTMPNGESRLVMVDEEAAWPQLARQLGFVQSRWLGVYSKSSSRLDFKGMSTMFPKARVVELTDDEIRARIRPLLLAHRDKRLSQLATNEKRLSWHPKKTPVSQAISEQAPAPAASPINPEAALHQTIFLGQNFQGQSVYESGDGVRFIKANEVVLASETQAAGQSPVFLRVGSDSDLVQVAAGMVLEIADGKNLKSDDFIRYTEAAFGVESSNDKVTVSRFHLALDRAMRDHVAALGGASQEVFDAALRMHDGRPSFWRADGEMPTPLPIAVVMQAIASSKVAALGGENPEQDPQLRVVDISGHAASNSWTLASENVTPEQVGEHDLALAGIFSAPIPEQAVCGIRVTRTDSKALLETVAKRADKGLSIFLVTTPRAGRLDTEFKRVISSIGQSHEVIGMVDLDAGLFGAGNSTSSRLIVIGDKRPAPDYTFSVPHEVSVVFDYDRLWTWTESVKSLDSAEVLTFGDDGREENRWQAPYIPKSQISEPSAMCPRNLLGPVRKALARVVETSGMDIDAFVCAKMGWTMKELEERLDAEQVDAVALAINAIEGADDGSVDFEGAGFTTADMTGLGKGRVVATVCAYARAKGRKVMFMTEKADLFSDFYRDVIDTGGRDVLSKPFIINNDLVVRDPYTNKTMFRSPDRETASQIMACGDFPADHDIVLATYSQFNREHIEFEARFRRQAAQDMRGLLNGSVTTLQALVNSAHVLGLPNYQEVADASSATLDAGFIKSFETNQAAVARAANNEDMAKVHELRASYAHMSNVDFAAVLKPLLGSSFTALKHQWAYSNALEGALLILDESHVAAGDASRTGINLQQMVERAGGVMYSSATYAKDVKNFRLYSRMFPGTLRVGTISETLTRGGEPMQEIVSAMLAEDGRLIRREHDLSSIEFRVTAETQRRDRNVAWANSFAEILASMSDLSGDLGDIASKLNEAYVKEANAKAEALHQSNLLVATQKANAMGKKLGVAGGVKTPKKPKAIPTGGMGYTSFASKLYNISRAFNMSLTADLAADKALAALESGRKPVITVENTMETTIRELIEGVDLDGVMEDEAAAAPENGGDLLGGVGENTGDLPGVEGQSPAGTKKGRGSGPIELNRRVSFKDILGAYVDAMFGAWEYTYTPEGKIQTKTRIKLGTPEMEAVAQEIRMRIAQMEEIPLSPIDLVRDRIAASGYSVDEISGRQYRLTENAEGLHVIERLAKRNKQTLKNGFNSGDIDALILSKSGSTGISLHASRTFADQSQRVLIELQPAADIAQRLQFWGRVNRKGQVCSPIVEMLSSGLPAENRLIAMQNNKLRRMSANTNGSADNSSINENAPDIINKIGNEVCFRWMENNAKIASVIGFEMSEIDEEMLKQSTKFVDMLTSRMMMFPVHMQEKIYADITTEFNAVMEQHELEGRNPLKAAEFDLRARVNEQRVIQVATGVDSVFDNAVVASELEYDINLPPLDPEAILLEAEAGREALVQDHGDDWARKLTAEFAKLSAAALPGLLSKRFPTIEAAMADGVPSNSISRALYKAEKFERVLERFTPGSITLVGDRDTKEEDGFAYDRLYITGIKVPKDNRLSLAAWKVVGWSANKRKRVDVSMASLLKGDQYDVSAAYVDQFKGSKKKQAEESRYYQDTVDRYFARNSVPFSGKSTRVVLAGNLYRAAELADSLSTGQTVTYSDAKGVWHHGVLMPSHMSIRRVGMLPVICTDADMVMAAAQAKEDGMKAEEKLKTETKRSSWHAFDRHITVTDSFRNELTSTGLVHFNYQLRITPHVAQLRVVNGKSLRDAMVGHKELQPFMNGAWDTSGRDLVTASSAPGQTREFVEEVLRFLETKGVKALLDGHMREWYNEYVSEKTGLANTAARTIEEELLDDTADELTSLMASP